MYILRIEHTVPDYVSWKKNGFDSDPLDRKGSGVVRYRILRPIDDPRYVMIDLEFNTRTKAEAMLSNLKILWSNVRVKFEWKDDPRAKIVKATEDTKLS